MIGFHCFAVLFFYLFDSSGDQILFSWAQTNAWVKCLAFRFCCAIWSDISAPPMPRADVHRQKGWGACGTLLWHVFESDQEMIVLIQARQISRELLTCHRLGWSGAGWELLRDVHLLIFLLFLIYSVHMSCKWCDHQGQLERSSSVRHFGAKWKLSDHIPGSFWFPSPPTQLDLGGLAAQPTPSMQLEGSVYVLDCWSLTMGWCIVFLD